MSAVIETERLTLRPIVVADAEALCPLYTDDETMRFWHTSLHATVAQTRSMIADMTSKRQSCWFAIVLRGEAKACGLVGFHGGERRSGFGYLLRRDLWRRGIGLEASRAAIDFAFAKLGFDRLELWIHEGNRASIALAEKLGARERGRFRQLYPGESFTRETLVYGLERPGRVANDLTRVEPVLGVSDMKASLAFYVERLGFEVEWQVPDAMAGLARGEWSTSCARVRLALGARISREQLVFRLESGVDELAAELSAKGVAIEEGPVTRPWGLRELVVRDPDGRGLVFSAPASG